jgi:hypothetical protein
LSDKKDGGKKSADKLLSYQHSVLEVEAKPVLKISGCERFAGWLLLASTGDHFSCGSLILDSWKKEEESSDRRYRNLTAWSGKLPPQLKCNNSSSSRQILNDSTPPQPHHTLLRNSMYIY